MPFNNPLDCVGAPLIFISALKTFFNVQIARFCAQIGSPGADMHALDPCDHSALETLATVLLSRQGAIDVFVAAPHIHGMPSGNHLGVLDADPKLWDEEIEANVLAPMRTALRITPSMVEHHRGTLIAIIPTITEDKAKDMPGVVAWAAAVKGWANSCREVLQGTGVNVAIIETALETLTGESGGQEDVVEAALMPFELSEHAMPAEVILDFAPAEVKSNRTAHEKSVVEKYSGRLQEPGDMEVGFGGVVEELGGRIVKGKRIFALYSCFACWAQDYLVFFSFEICRNVRCLFLEIMIAMVYKFIPNTSFIPYLSFLPHT